MDLTDYRFPLFVDLTGKKVLVVGAGTIALRRIRVLLSFGADITVVAPAAQPLPEAVTYLPRAYRPEDLQGAFLAVAATDSREVNRQVGLDAGNLGIFVSVADRREESTFYFPAICAGNGLVAGVVSQGSEHHKTAAAAKQIRRVLEELT